MVISPGGLGTKNDSAGEDQQQFTRPDLKNVIMNINTEINTFRRNKYIR
jgi:hypothetical protein